MILSMQEQHDLMMMSYDGPQIENPPAFSKTPRKQVLTGTPIETI